MEVGSSSVAAKGSVGITAGGSLNVLATGNITETIVNASVPPTLAARKTTATFGDIDFNTANFGIGNFNVDIGPLFPGAPGGTGPLASFQMTPTGEITIKSLLGVGGVLKLSGLGIELSYLNNSIKIGPTGIDINGSIINIEALAALTTKGLLVTSEASGINAVKGSLVTLN